MTVEDIDPGLYGAWGQGGYCGRDLPPGERDAPAARRAASALLIEIKSAEALVAGANLRALLNEVTEELKAQLVLFQRLRMDAARAFDDPGGDQKLARADLKAATDAIALIVRTLDKTDELQRKANDDSEAEEARHVDDETLSNLCESLNRHISDRADALARDRLAGGPVPAEPPPDDAPG